MSKPRLSIIPAGAIFDRSREPRDLQVIGLLGCHTDKAGWCRRSQVKMAAQLGCGRASVQRSLDRLVDAGWVQKKRPPWSNEGGQPSHSYMYRVVLDRDDYVSLSNDDDEGDESGSYAENADDGVDCPPVGTLENEPKGARPAGHPGAQPYVGTGAQPYVGTKNDPLERPPIEREREARARDRNAKFLAAFEPRWPTSVLDDRHRLAYAAAGLTDAEQEECLQGIAPFLEMLKRAGRKAVPAGWKFIEDRKWKLLPKPAGASVTTLYPPDSVEAKAVAALHELVGRGEAFRKIYRRADGSVSFRLPVTPQLAKLVEMPGQADWPVLDYQQGGAWEGFVKQFFEDGVVRKHFREGARAPWAWPPRKDGSLSPAGEKANDDISEI
jgi:hypothetical protein